MWAMLGSGFSQASSMGSSILLGRILGLEGFGNLALLQATIVMFGNFGEAGLSLTTTKFTSAWSKTDPPRAGRFIGWALLITAALAVLSAFVLFGAQRFLTLSSSALGTREFAAAGAILIFDMLNRVQLGALAGIEAFSATARLQWLRGLLLLPVVYLGAHQAGLVGAIAGLGLVSLLVFAAGQMVLRKECAAVAVPLHYGRTSEKGVYGTSASLWAGSWLLSGSTWVVYVLMSKHSEGVTQVGLYNAADKFRIALVFLPQVLFQVILPMLSERRAAGDHAACRRIVAAALGGNAAITGTAAALVAFIAPGLMSAYGPAFARGANVLPLAAASAVAGGFYTIGGSALWAIGKPSQMLGIDILRTVLLLGLCVFGLAADARGVMLAWLISYSLAGALLLAVVYRQLQANFSANLVSTTPLPEASL